MKQSGPRSHTTVQHDYAVKTTVSAINNTDFHRNILKVH